NQSQPKAAKTNPAVSTATKITPMRRAIALLLQHPALATVMPQAPELAQANLPGIEILLTLQHKLLQQPGLTTAQLLEHWRGAVEYN
ncbi:hypothetical protein ACI3PL_24910, partial [Lacticaseibacillus paracasei]